MLTHQHRNGDAQGRVVVLGAGGVIGRWLSAHFDRTGQSYLALDRAALDLVSAEAGDNLLNHLRDGDALVFLSTVTPDRARGLGAVQANLAMTQAVLSAVRSGRLAHLVYLSSDAVYGRYDQLISEESPAEPGDLHGAMHRTRELLLAEAPSMAVVRATLLYGHGDTHNSYGPNRFLASARGDGVVRMFGGGEETRDHLFLGDLATLLANILSHRSCGVINAASGKSVSYADLAALLADLYPGLRIEQLPRSGPVTHRHFDTSELVRAFPDFRMTSIEDGLRLTKLRYDQPSS